MVIFLEEIGMQLFLWLLQLTDGIMDIFDAITGIGNVVIDGEETTLVQGALGNSTVQTIFWCMFVLGVGLACIFTIVAVVKNMYSNDRTISSIVGKFLTAILGTVIVMMVVVLGIMIADSLIVLVADIFRLDTSQSLSASLFDACVGDWNDGYSIADFSTSLKVRDLLGDYKTAMWVWPTSWKGNGMIDPDTFMYLPALIAGVALCFALILACVNLSKRLFEIVFAYLAMPAAMSTLPLDDGARFRNWREVMVTKVLMSFGTVLSVNIYALLLPVLTSLTVPGLGSFAGSIFRLLMIAGGALVIPGSQSLFARIFAKGEDAHPQSYSHIIWAGTRAVTGAVTGAVGGVASLALRGVKACGRAVGDREGGEDRAYRDDTPEEKDKEKESPSGKDTMYRESDKENASPSKNAEDKGGFVPGGDAG